MSEVEVRASDLDEVQAEAQLVLDRRRDEIVDGRLDGQHWFIALLQESKSILAHRRALSVRHDVPDRT